jgi:methylmalonyl-CoA mutase
MSETPETSGAEHKAPELKADFPPHTYEQWKEAAVKLLKGAPFDKKLLTPLAEGITLQPLYRSQDIEGLEHLGTLPGLPPYVRGGRAAGYAGARWAVSQQLVEATPEQLNAAALNDLGRGQHELNIRLDAATRAGKDALDAEEAQIGAGGLSLSTLADLDQALAGVELEQTAVFLRGGARALAAGSLLMALADQRGVADELTGCVGYDPLGILAAEGSLPTSLEEAFREMAVLTRAAISRAPKLQTIVISGLPYRDAGAHGVQELGYALATGVEYLRALRLEGLSVDQVAPRMRFCFGLGSNFFLEIAKLRAARYLWSKVLGAYGADAAAAKMHIHGATSSFNKSAFDPHVNLLRGTTEAFSAIVGGVDSLHIDAYDARQRAADEFSRRTARNTQLVLAEECELDHVADPAGGSWYIEWLTDQLSRRGWELFQAIEEAGGMAKALEAGTPQADVAEVAKTQRDKLATRRTQMIGVNVYPIAGERPLEARAVDHAAVATQRRAALEAQRSARGDQSGAALDAYAKALLEHSDQAVEHAISALKAGATLGELEQAAPSATPVSGSALPSRRLAEDFEDLRLAALAYADKHGAPPKIFQVNLGPSRRYRARADWTTGFFQVGGFAVDASTDFDGADEAIAAAKESGASIVALCSDDERYGQELPALAQQLRVALPKAHLLLAGAPGDNEQAWREAGIQTFVNVRSNTYALLRQLLAEIGALS